MAEPEEKLEEEKTPEEPKVTVEKPETVKKKKRAEPEKPPEEAKPEEAPAPELPERGTFPAKCAKCGRDCEVPFQPTEGRPVYCRECFQEIREQRGFGGPGYERRGYGPREYRPREFAPRAPRPRKAGEENIVFVGSMKGPMPYALAIITQLGRGPKCVVKARGRAISTAVDAVEITRKRFLADVKIESIKIDSEEVEDEMGRKRTVSSIEITLSK